MKEINFPRKIPAAELELLLSILPEEKSGYNKYRKIIPEMLIIGEGRFGRGNLILGTETSSPDPSVSSSPVFAVGSVLSGDKKIDILIHSLDEGMIEIQIDPYPLSGNVRPENVITYSEWNPGMKSPETNSRVYEYEIKKDEFILAVSPPARKIWLHEYKSGINHIIPLSNFFNELMRLRKVKDERVIASPSRFFNEIDTYPASEIKLAFLMYDKYFRRFSLGDVLDGLLNDKVNRKKHFKLFGRGIN